MESLHTDAHSEFSWERLDGIGEGRITLGNQVPVLIYRMMQFSIFDVLIKELGVEKAQVIVRKAGYLAGVKYAKNVLDLTLSFDDFVPILKNSLIDLRIGILDMESFNARTGKITLTVSEYLDCSGLSATNETIYYYDEGFIAGILDSYTEKTYTVRKIECWANGDWICRFCATVED